MTYLTTNSQNFITQAKCQINNQALRSFHYAKFEWINVAEHELGHAIGLNHNPGKASVMYVANRSYSIQKVDTDSVRQLYSLPSVRISTGSKGKRIADPIVNLKKSRAPINYSRTYGIVIHRKFMPMSYVDLVQRFAYENQILIRLAHPLQW